MGGEQDLRSRAVEVRVLEHGDDCGGERRGGGAMGASRETPKEGRGEGKRREERSPRSERGLSLRGLSWIC